METLPVSPAGIGPIGAVHFAGAVGMAALLGLVAGPGLSRACTALGAPWPGTPLPFRAPALAVAAALCFMVSARRYGLGARFVWEAAYVLYMLAVIVIDGERRVIPDRLNAAGCATGLILLLLWQPIPWPSALAGALLTTGFLHVGWLLNRGGIGGGDLKLSPGLGLFLGWPGAVAGLAVGLALGAVTALIRLIVRPARWREPFAYGPALAVGGLVGLYAGDWLLAVWLAL